MDDSQKQRLQISLVVANLAIILYQIFFNSGLFGGEFSTLRLIIAIILGAAVGGVTFFVTKFFE